MRNNIEYGIITLKRHPDSSPAVRIVGLSCTASVERSRARKMNQGTNHIAADIVFRPVSHIIATPRVRPRPLEL